MTSALKQNTLPNRDFQKKIKSKIHNFEIISLVQLLVYHGYRPDEIRFKGHASTCSQKALINSIEFMETPIRCVEIEVNFGLLSAQGPLPSYFQKNIREKGIDARLFSDFIGFFDNHLIWDYILNIYPESNRKIFTNWSLLKLRYIQMLDLKSLDTLTWLFDLVFPELVVKIEKAILQHGMETHAFRLGASSLDGESIFGKKTVVPVNGLRIIIYSDEEFVNTGKPWPEEIKYRFNDQIAPILGPVGINLELDLIIRSQKRWVELHEESYLGYDKLKGGTSQAYRRIRIFQGRVKPLENNESMPALWQTLNG